MAFPAKRLTHHILHYIHPLFTHLRETLCHVDFTVPPPRSVKFVQGNIGPRSTTSVTKKTHKNWTWNRGIISCTSYTYIVKRQSPTKKVTEQFNNFVLFD